MTFQGELRNRITSTPAGEGHVSGEAVAANAGRLDHPLHVKTRLGRRMSQTSCKFFLLFLTVKNAVRQLEELGCSADVQEGHHSPKTTSRSLTVTCCRRAVTATVAYRDKDYLVKDRGEMFHRPKKAIE